MHPPILQTQLPYDPFARPKLPGVAPCAPNDWLLRDEAYAGQVARRRALLASSAPEVLAQSPGALAAAQELLQMTLAHLQLDAAHKVEAEAVLCPDGVRVRVDRAAPLETLGRLVQEDFCILEKDGQEHVLTGAVLCFPASWRLSEKFMRPLLGIHAPVPEYDGDIARRVQRLFDGVRPGRPIWRNNALWYEDPELHQPRSRAAPRPATDPAQAAYFRSERQVILRLPRTNAVVFAIHTYVLRREDALSAFGT